MFSLVIFTAFVCYVFLVANPVLSSDIDALNFTKDEMFMPSDGHYDFKIFRLSNSNTSYFKVKYVEPGHVLLVDETGKKVINIVRLDNMINIWKDNSGNFIKEELSKTGWMVDGVEVHEIEFAGGEKLYSACSKDISSGTLIYLATPDDRETAGKINSLTIED